MQSAFNKLLTIAESGQWVQQTSSQHLMHNREQRDRGSYHAQSHSMDEEDGGCVCCDLALLIFSVSERGN